MDTIESPCIKICRYDSSGMCYGCKRTLVEIGNWTRFTPEQRREIMLELPSRSNREEQTGFAF